MWWIRNDPCGMFSALLVPPLIPYSLLFPSFSLPTNFSPCLPLSQTVLLILYSQYVICNVILYPWYGLHWHMAAYSTCSVMALIAHSRAQFTDPGAVPRHRPAPSPQADGSEAYIPPRLCKRCKCLKPYRAHHCSTCSRCIIRMDHHCPWVNNCIAIFNQKYFVLFLFYTALCCIYAASLLIARFVSCSRNLRLCSITPLQTALCIINFIEALVFGLFCCIMMVDQMTAIFDNTPGIDALQNRQGVKRGRYESLKAVFGESIGVRWLLPTGLPSVVWKDFEEELKIDAADYYGDRQVGKEAIYERDVPAFPTLAASIGQSGGVLEVEEEEKSKKGERRMDEKRFRDDDKEAHYRSSAELNRPLNDLHKIE